MAERDGKEEQLKQEVESQRRKENKPDEYREGKRRLSAPSCSTPNPKRALLTTVGKTENGNSKDDFTQDSSDNPPRLNFEVPKLSDLPKACSKSWNDVELPVDFLLLTVEDCEFLGFFPYLEEPFKSYRKDIGYVWFGYMGSTVGSVKKLKIALMKCSKGSVGPGGSLTVVKNAVSVLRPKSVFSVGACSGLSRGKVKLGDVVVSSKLITPTHKTPASRDIGTLIRHAADGWNAPLANPDAVEVRVHCDGAVLSSPEVISEDMIQQYPEAIAVDTEGEGVFAAAHDLKTEWVVVKGIKDYADGSQPSSDEWGRFASVMAASVVANILSDPVVFEEWSNYNQEASPVDSFDVKTCQRKLVEHYRKTAKVPTTVWSSAFQVDLDQIYTRLSWVKEEQTLAGTSKKELGHYTELFTEKTKNGAVPKRILVQGETGIGKTTFVKKLLVDWSNLEEAKMNEDRKDPLRKFELVLSINLKDVSKCQTLREVISHSRLFPEDEEKSIDDLLSYIRNNQEKVLVMFDGYDEYRTGSEAEEKYGSRSSSPIYKIFHGNILRDCTVLVTTRSSRADEIRGPADIQAEVTGFNMSDREEFMGKILKSQTQVGELLGFLAKSKMEDLARVPLLALFFCLLWKEKKKKLTELVRSKTKLFRAIVKHILQHSHRKHSPSHVSKLKEADYEEILAEIGKVALEGLMKGDLMFDYDQLSEKVRGEQSIIVGLLQVSDEYGPSLEPVEMVSFIHKSIQEYLAAWYIAHRCVPEGSLGDIEQHAHTLEDCKAMENVFQFICGLSDEGAVKVFQHLTSVRISDPALDLSTTIPDVENETTVPLCDVTDIQKRFINLVYDCFREVCSKKKAELFSQCLDCTGRIVLVTRERPLSELVPNANVLTELAHYCVLPFKDIFFDSEVQDSVMHDSLEFLNCLQLPVMIPGSSKLLTVGDLRVVEDRQFAFLFGLDCFFSAILCCRNGQFQFYITELSLGRDDHARLFTESTADSAPSSAARSCSEQSCLKFLSSLYCDNLSGEILKALGAVIRNCKHLNRIEVRDSDESVCDLLEQVPNPSKCSLTIGALHRSSRGIVNLTSAGAVQIASLLSRYNNIISLLLDLKDCCSTVVDTLITSITHKTLERLELSGISLTPAAAAALGHSLPEMSSLQELKLTGVDGSILQAEEMEALFGRFSKTLPLWKLTFSGFSVAGSIASLTNSFPFFPNLEMLHLAGFDVDEHNLCCLLDSLRFVPNLLELEVLGKPLSYSHCFTVEDTVGGFTHRAFEKLVLSGISLTPAAAAALGRSLPEMSSLKVLRLTGVHGRISRVEEIEALFGKFNKPLPLRELTFSDFSVEGSIAPLTNSFRFFPNLRELCIGGFSMDEHNLCCLFNSLSFVPDLMELAMLGKQRRYVDYKLHTSRASYRVRKLALYRLVLSEITQTPAAAAVLGRLLPEMSYLEELELTGVDGSILEAKEMDVLFGGLNKALPLWRLNFSNFNIKGCLSPFILIPPLRLFPNLREWKLEKFVMAEHDQCSLLESLKSIPNLRELIVQSTAEVNPITSVAHMTLKLIHLDGISLTPAVAAALGRSLPEMSSLEVLEITGVDGSILKAKEMEALFGGFNKTLPLHRFTFSGFSVGGCLAPLTKSFRFFPNLRDLNLGWFNAEFSMDEQNLCLLLESLRFIPNLETLSVKGKSLSEAHCCTAEVNPVVRVTLNTLEQLHLDGIRLTPAVAVVLGRLLPGMVSLKVLELTGVDGSVLEAKEIRALFGGFNKTLPLSMLTFSGFSTRGCLASLTKILHFFPNLRELNLGELNMDENDLCGLLNAVCSTVEGSTMANMTRKSLEKLNLIGISLTPAVAAALCRLLPEMPSLEILELTGVDGSILEAKEMEALFGGFNKTLPLRELTFRGFSVRGSLAPLTNSFRFFPNLRELNLGGFNREFNMDEQNLCLLLESLRFIPNLTKMSLKGKLESQAHCCTAEIRPIASVSHKTLEQLHLDGLSLTPAVAVVLGRSLPEMSSLQELKLTGVGGSILEAKEMEALFGGFNKTLPLSELTFCGFSVRGGCLAPLTKSFCFFPNLRELNFNEELIMNEQNLCLLLESLRFIPKLKKMGLKGKLESQAHCCTADVNQVASVTRKTLEHLRLDGISLTPAAAAVLGELLPEMSSLQELKLTGVDGSILEANEMEALFGRFNKTLSFSKLTFSSFSVRGSLAPLNKSFRFFPKLRELNLEKLDMDEHDLAGLLESFQFIPGLCKLNLSGNPLGHAVRSIVPHVSNLQELKYLWIDQTGHSEEDLNYVRDTLQQTLPELKIQKWHS
ncbi:uncharacterized protein LOC144650893 isoform X2 [Oculina patagonica]